MYLRKHLWFGLLLVVSGAALVVGLGAPPSVWGRPLMAEMAAGQSGRALELVRAGGVPAMAALQGPAGQRPLDRPMNSCGGLRSLPLGQGESSGAVAPQEAALSITITDDEAGRGPICPGSLILFNITVRNIGTTTLNDVTVRVRLAAATQPILSDPATSPGARHDTATNSVLWTIATLAPGESRSFGLRIRTFTSFPGGTVLVTEASASDAANTCTATDTETTNIAVCGTPVPSNTPGPTSTPTATATPTPLPARLEVEINDDEGPGRIPICPGYTIHYDIIVRNVGQMPLDNVLATVQLETAVPVHPLLDSPRTSPGATYDEGTKRVHWTIPRLEPGQTVIYTLLTRTFTTVPGGTTLHTQAIASDDVAPTVRDTEETSIAICTTATPVPSVSATLPVVQPSETPTLAATEVPTEIPTEVATSVPTSTTEASPTPGATRDPTETPMPSATATATATAPVRFMLYIPVMLRDTE